MSESVFYAHIQGDHLVGQVHLKETVDGGKLLLTVDLTVEGGGKATVALDLAGVRALRAALARGARSLP